MIVRPLRIPVLLVAIAACGREQPQTGPATGADTVAAARPAEWQQCDNAPAGAAISFPAGWHTNDGSVMPACSLFDPEPIRIPAGSEIPEGIAVSISAQDVAFETVAGSTFALRVISTEEREVAGRRAVARLVEHTGEGLYDRGMRSWQYIIEWGDGRTLIAESHSADEPDFDVKRATLDAMMQRLQRRQPL